LSTEWERVREFPSGLRERCAADGGYVAIVEVCGFNDWLLKLLPEYGCRDVVLIQADERSRENTDRRDASRLSELLWINRRCRVPARRGCPPCRSGRSGPLAPPLSWPESRQGPSARRRRPL